MVLTLVGLLLLLFLSVRFLRRLGRGSFLGLKSGKSIQVVEKRALSQKTVLYLVDIEGKRVLLSESQCEVRSLAVIDQALTEH
jgi:flagellar biogenesis protein FliO